MDGLGELESLGFKLLVFYVVYSSLRPSESGGGKGGRQTNLSMGGGLQTGVCWAWWPMVFLLRLGWSTAGR